MFCDLCIVFTIYPEGTFSCPLCLVKSLIRTPVHLFIGELIPCLIRYTCGQCHIILPHTLILQGIGDKLLQPFQTYSLVPYILQNTINSSPPIRPTISDSRNSFRTSDVISTRNASPNKCPRVSFTILKSSISITNSA